MHERYQNRKLYFDEQAYTTEKYVIPFIANKKLIDKNSRILEIGCGEGGNLKPFMDIGCYCMGIDLNDAQIQNAVSFYENHANKNNLRLQSADIYTINPSEYQADIIMLRDVIEHIHNQEKFMQFVKQFLQPDGVIFFAFPPWYMPFGGHQQVCKGKISKVPYFHIFPTNIYKKILEMNKVDEKGINDLLEIKETGITIERFERIAKRENFQILLKEYYFINPNYEIKFNLKPRKSLPLFRSIPYIRNFYITSGYYLLKLNE